MPIIRTLVIKHDNDCDNPLDHEYDIVVWGYGGRDYGNMGTPDSESEMQKMLWDAIDEIMRVRCPKLHAQGYQPHDEHLPPERENPYWFDNVKDGVEIYRKHQHLLRNDNPYKLYVYDTSVGINGYGYVDLYFALQTTKVLNSYGYKSDMTREKILTKAKKQRMNEMFDNMAEVFQSWVDGDCYGFTLYEHQPHEEPDDGEEIDSCWGFYGSDWETNGMKDNLDTTAMVDMKVELPFA